MAIRELGDLEPTEFENLAYDMLRASGLRNLVWRTPGADGGRDLEGQFVEHDFAGSHVNQKWYIEIKRYQAAVDWPTVWQKLAYADNASADYLLMITTSSFSPKCLDEIDKWNEKRLRPRIRHWAGHEVIFRIRQQPAISIKYGLAETPENTSTSFEILTSHLNKMTLAAFNNYSINGTPGRYLESSSSISELMMSRTEDILRTGRISIQRPLRHEAWFDWLKISPKNSLDNFDTPSIRALTSTMMVIYKSSCIEINIVDPNSISLEICQATPIDNDQSSTPLLNAIAHWGNIELRENGEFKWIVTQL